VLRVLREPSWWSAVRPFVGQLDGASACALVALVASASPEPVERQGHLEAFLAHPDAAVRSAVVAALHELRCPAGFASIERMIATGEPAEQRAAVRLIVDLSPPNKVALLTPLLGASDIELRRLAVREVSRVSFVRYLDRFDGMDTKARQVAARALAKIDEQMLDRVTEEIGALDADRRLKALQIVDLLGAEQELRAPLLDLLDDPDKRVRATAIRIVELTGSIEGIQVLLAALADPDRRVRANAVEAFEQMEDPRFVQMLVPFLRDQDNRVRANAAKALWNLGWSGARDALLQMLADANELMRLSAVWAIGELQFPGAREVLMARAVCEPSLKVKTKIREAVDALPGNGVRS
jgi:HEAT repeat protein